MKRRFLLLLICFALGQLTPIKAQDYWFEPSNATVNDELTIYLRASNRSSVNMYAGVRVGSSTFQYINNNDWNSTPSHSFFEEDPNQTNVWKKTIKPSSYFGVPEGTVVKGIDIIFREGSSKIIDADLFLDLDDAQVNAPSIWLESSPEKPLIDQEVTITFRPSEAPGGSLRNAERIFAHTWAITSGPDSNNADYEGQAHWGDNTKGEFKNKGDGVWELTFTPRDHYNISDPYASLFKIGFVFRDETGANQQKTAEGEDIYLQADPGFYITQNEPLKNKVSIKKGETVDLKFTAIENSNWEVILNGESEHTVDNATSLSHSITFSEKEDTEIIVKASTLEGEYTQKTIAVNVFEEKIAELPAWAYYGNQPRMGIIYHNGLNSTENDPSKTTLVLHTPTNVTYKSGTGEVYGVQSIPNKEVVNVIGDFNNWMVTEEYQMYNTPDGNYFWITIENLEAQKPYVFQYLIDGDLHIADPYAEHIVDSDDSYIPESTFPSLPEYPHGKASDRASLIQTGMGNYAWQISNFQPVSHNLLNIYELHFRDFTEEGTYKAAMAKLPYLKDMGINCIHVMPISEFEGNDSWGYNPNFYFAPDKAYGTKQDLKQFIDEAHKMDIAVINDLVLNHSFHSSPFSRMYYNDIDNKPAPYNPWYNEDHNFDEPAAHWGVDFNHTSEHTQALVDSVTNFWMSEYKFDGFRFDFTKGFSNTHWVGEGNWGSDYDQDRVDILKRMANKVWSNHPGSIVCFEHLANQTEDSELANHGILMWSGAGLNYNYSEMAKNNFKNIDISSAYYKNVGFNLQNWMSYMESHDEERLAFRAVNEGRNLNSSNNFNGGANDNQLQIIIPRLQATATFNLLLPGPRMIWQFGELAYDYSINYNGRTGRKPVKWEYFEHPERKKLYRTYADLLSLRNNYDLYVTADQNQDFDLAQGHKRTTLNSRDKGESGNATFQVIAVGNFMEETQDITPYFGSTGTWYDFETGDSYEVTSTDQTVRLEAGRARVFISKKLKKANLHNPVIVDHQEDMMLTERGQSFDIDPSWFTVEDEDNDLTTAFNLTILNGEGYTYDNFTITPDNEYFVGDLNVNIVASDGERLSDPYTFSLTYDGENVLFIRVKDQTYTYGDPELVHEVAFEGFVDDDDESILEGELVYMIENDKIKASGLTSDKYELAYVDGKYTFVKKLLNVKAEDITAIENGEHPPLAITYDGFVNGENENDLDRKPEIYFDGVWPLAKGVYTLTVAGAESENYDFEYEDGKLIVQGATPIIVTEWPIISKGVYGQKLSEISFTGGEANMDGSFEFVDKDEILNAGIYSNVTMQFIADDESAGSLKGFVALEIEKATQTIEITDTPQSLRIGESFELFANTNSGLAVSYESSDESIISVDGNIIIAHQEGEATITALQEGNDNYLESRLDFTVDVEKLTNIESPDQMFIYPNPANNIIFAKGIKTNMEYVIYDMNGRSLITGLLKSNQGISISSLRAGVYMLKLSDNSVHKIIKK
ncbi:alpha-amylase family glycosyl hydrolase [Aureibacter tunicatorum]|uniref:1,4-alpha-glucan branching enzyme n=1 Tax=Aureibacter tunicatorum TaxID=866807 RepID=A0AAE4BQ34_9BACT|nr:alpha-amylase family glycosyl hydrolase [Aureibacter tunicatorum]MDR6238674.1 1,4-alpha-glucan branching enzyme [Aureibacter tunicatorum]BDD05395.1 hypothetical protein AUTU_28780 [Aureibacter tunicatorum]